MTLWWGDALEVLRGLPDASVDMVATSPPFYGLRDYGVEGQIGLEDSPDEWVARLVAVFGECRRVLADHGTLWVECGDSYAASQTTDRRMTQPTGVDGRPATRRESTATRQRTTGGDVKPKDLIGSPFLLAFALRADGWWWRGVNIWAKPNAMPESAKDRCTVAHSYVLHFSKKARYFFDGEAIAEPAAWERWGDQTVPKHEGTDTAAGWIKPKGKNELLADIAGNGPHRTRAGFNERWDATVAENGYPASKHPRSVWTIPTQGYPEAHFATWPEALARKIILAGCVEGGTVLDPFGGSGTTALVARKLGRKAVLIELSEAYCALAADRLSQLSLLAEAQ